MISILVIWNSFLQLSNEVLLGAEEVGFTYTLISPLELGFV